jgi:DamX protein
MVENDTLTYQVNKPFIAQKSRVFHALITQERTKKLELLIHLIANSRQALVVCGPEGIGKSTLLKVLQEHQAESMVLLPLCQAMRLLVSKRFKRSSPKASSRISLINTWIRFYPGFFGWLKHQNKKIVLMIDEAGHLAPGLINTLIEYAARNPVLRVILVLTHDDLYVKNTSDHAIENCHLIEIPPLSEKAMR